MVPNIRELPKLHFAHTHSYHRKATHYYNIERSRHTITSFKCVCFLYVLGSNRKCVERILSMGILGRKYQEHTWRVLRWKAVEKFYGKINWDSRIGDITQCSTYFCRNKWYNGVMKVYFLLKRFHYIPDYALNLEKL